MSKGKAAEVRKLRVPLRYVLLHKGTGVLFRLGFNQWVKVLWHPNPADEQETRLWSKFAQDLHVNGVRIFA
jgi:hypothetical protein